MKGRFLYFIIVACFIAAVACNDSRDSNHFSNGYWIDLTHTFDSTSLYWPNNASGFVHNKDFYGVNTMGFFYASYNLKAPEHGGTHLDSPIHFANQKQTVDQIPLSSLTGMGEVIDISSKCVSNRDYELSIADLEEWSASRSNKNDSIILIVKTGYGKYYPDRTLYFGTDELGDAAIPKLHFPGISKDAAEWIVRFSMIKAVGIDTPSLDRGQSKEFWAHRVLLGANIPGFENVANLDMLSGDAAYIVALPMKIGQGSGAPLRIIAFQHK